ncbi:hypothetical protein [Nesterenkonia ebinurensis]|uniref:hypothetical protein n=1 Tax=Nesterenkonia ebinurensis TaxID=2608252 RepID=UPI00123DCC6A|nr:hypothetical protein [Nesterenkonia ebinurensis]
MKTPDLSQPRIRRRLIAALAAGIILLLVTGVGLYGLITGPPAPTPGTHNDDSGDVSPGPVVTAPDDPEPSTPPSLSSVPASTDAETFARNVAETLFAWDTASGFMPLDYTSVILAVGDPTGAEQAGLASDIATYLPAQESWVELRQYSTTQHLSIENAFVPEAWAEAVEQTQAGQLPPGAIAYTIEGTRHRDGIWNNEPVASEHAVAFTVFIACPPGESCYLLRLSQLDNPLR